MTRALDTLPADGPVTLGADAEHALGEAVVAGIADRATRFGLDPSTFRCRIEPFTARLLVAIEVGEEIDKATAQALSVRAFDILRDIRRLGTSRIDIAVVARPPD